MYTLQLMLMTLMLSGAAYGGEAGGAYGGGTAAPPTERFEQVDQDRDGGVDEEEARSAGIEMFREADEDRNGTLDRSEFSALEDDGTVKKRCDQ